MSTIKKHIYRILIAEPHKHLSNQLIQIIQTLLQRHFAYVKTEVIEYINRGDLTPSLGPIHLAFIDASFVDSKNVSLLEELRINSPKCKLVLLLSSHSNLNMTTFIAKLNALTHQFFIHHILKDNLPIHVLEGICRSILDDELKQQNKL